MELRGGHEARRTPPYNSHNGRHSAAILDEEVAKGLYNPPRDWARGHSQAAIFCIIGTTQCWGGGAMIGERR